MGPGMIPGFLVQGMQDVVNVVYAKECDRTSIRNLKKEIDMKGDLVCRMGPGWSW